MNRTMRAANARNIRQIKPQDNWTTPEWIFAQLDREFSFVLDVCNQLGNPELCPFHFTPADNGLIQNWAPHTCWMNPPYSDIGMWTKKAVQEVRRGATVVGLLPVRADLGWFHRDVVELGAEIRFVQGRLRFGGADRTAPFASMVVIWRPEQVRTGLNMQSLSATSGTEEGP